MKVHICMIVLVVVSLHQVFVSLSYVQSTQSMRMESCGRFELFVFFFSKLSRLQIFILFSLHPTCKTHRDMLHLFSRSLVFLQAHALLICCWTRNGSTCTWSSTTSSSICSISSRSRRCFKKTFTNGRKIFILRFTIVLLLLHIILYLLTFIENIVYFFCYFF